MYHPSVFFGIPNIPGVYVLRRKVKPYKLGTRTVEVNRVAVVGQSETMRTRMKQYFCEHTETAMSANIRNAAIAVREQITHIDIYTKPEIMRDKVSRKAFERVLSEELEAMFRPPKKKDNVGKESANLSMDTSFRTTVLEEIGEPSHSVRLPNMDNIVSDLLRMDQNLYGVTRHHEEG